MGSEIIPMSRQEALVVQELIDEVLIYDLKTDKAFCLNETSALVWKLCDGTKAVGDIARSIAGKTNSTVTEDLVWLALDQLKKENLLANADDIAPAFNGMSRRQMIRKVGLASMIALPVISSLVAPTSASAQSACIPVTEPCTSGGTPCCPLYGNPAACIDLSGTGAGPFVCIASL